MRARRVEHVRPVDGGRIEHRRQGGRHDGGAGFHHAFAPCAAGDDGVAGGISPWADPDRPEAHRLENCPIELLGIVFGHRLFDGLLGLRLRQNDIETVGAREHIGRSEACDHAKHDRMDILDRNAALIELRHKSRQRRVGLGPALADGGDRLIDRPCQTVRCNHCKLADRRIGKRVGEKQRAEGCRPIRELGLVVDQYAEIIAADACRQDLQEAADRIEAGCCAHDDIA